MSVTTEINSIMENIDNAYDKIEDLGIDLTDVNKNIDNISSMLENVWNEYPKVSASDVEEASINGTKKGRMNIDAKGNTEQYTTNGANLLKFTARTTAGGGTNYVCNTKGEVTLTGRASSSAGLYYNSENDAVTLNSGTYTLKVIGTGIENLRFNRTDTLDDIALNENNEATILVAEDNTAFRIVFYKSNGTTYNANFRITLASGNTATTEYYTGGTASPNSDYPQTIHNVSGNNELKIQNKNLFNESILNQYKIDEDNEAYIFNSNTLYNVNLTPNVKFKENTAYTIQYIAKQTTGNPRLRIKYTDGTYDNVQTSSIATSYTKYIQVSNPQKTIDYITEVHSTITTDSFYIKKNSVMVEIGTTATDYVSHQEQNLPLNLKSKNLFDKNNVINAYLNADGTTTANSTFRVSDYIDISNISNLTISGNYGGSEFCCFYDANKTFVSNFGMSTLTTRTVSVPTNAKYIRVTVRNNVLDNYQLEQGSTATSYEPYYEYEVSKIDTAKDFPFKAVNGDKYYDSLTEEEKNALNYGSWYLHKDLFEKLFNGNENFYIFNSRLNDVIGVAISNTWFKAQRALCNYFIYDDVDVLWNANKEGFGVTNSYIVFYIGKDKATNITEFKQWVANHNINVLGATKTPTNIEITETTLINQLEAIRKAQSYNDQTNISQTNEDLPFILDIETLKK